MPDLDRDEAKYFLLKKKNLNGRLKKAEIFKSDNSQYVFAKISEIGPWIYRINWCKGHGYSSTHIVVRLPERRPLYSKKGQKCIFQTAWQPYRLSHIHALCINLSYKPKHQSLKFWRKNIKNWQVWKSQFFESVIFFSTKRILFFFCFIPIEIRHQLWNRIDGTQFLWLLWFQTKNNPSQTFFEECRAYLLLTRVTCSTICKLLHYLQWEQMINSLMQVKEYINGPVMKIRVTQSKTERQH